MNMAILPIRNIHVDTEGNVYYSCGRQLKSFRLNRSESELTLEEGQIRINTPWDIRESCSSEEFIFLWGKNKLCCTKRDALVNDIFNDDPFIVSFKDYIIQVTILEGYIWVILGHGQLYCLNPQDLSIKYSVKLSEDFLVLSAEVFLLQDNVIHVAYGTVFNGVELFVLDDTEVSLKRKGCLMGHEGSIYSIAFNAQEGLLASASDDRTICIWDLTQDGVLKVRLTGHGSRVWKVIWDSRIKVLISGSEDAVIKVWEYGNNNIANEEGSFCVLKTEKQYHEGESVWGIACNDGIIVSGGDDCSIRAFDLLLLQSHNLKIYESAHDSEPKCFDFISSDSSPVVVVNEKGTIENIKSDIAIQNLRRHSIIRRIKGTNNGLVFGNLEGQIFIQFKNNEHCMWQSAEDHSKIIYLESWSVTVDDCLFLVQMGSGSIFILKLINNNQFITHKLSLSNTFITSSSLIKGCCNDMKFILGSRDGKLIAIYSTKGEKEEEFQVSSSMQISTDCITCIRQSPFINSLIITTDRSGYLSAFAISTESASKSTSLLTRTWSVRLSKGWLEQVDCLSKDSWIVGGFESTLFILKEYPSQRIIYTCDTGGAHRCWRLSLSEKDPNQVNFGFIRLGKLYHVTIPVNVSDSCTIRGAFHCGEIRSLSALTIENNDYLITGGEDGKISLLNSSHYSIIKSSKMHKSGIKSIHSLDDGLFLMAGSSQELSLCSLNHGNMFKISSAPKVAPIKDVRILDVSYDEQSNQVVSAYSDSWTRLWSLEGDSFKLVDQWEAHEGHCSLKARFIDSSHVVSGGTDGFLTLKCLLDGTLTKLRVHQSGINSLECRNERILTGGDDGTISLSSFSPSTSTSLCLLNQVHLAHHSTITAIQWINNHIFASSSVDQRVKIWNIKEDLSIELLLEERISVADVGAMIAQLDKSACRLHVAGIGIQCIEIDLSQYI